MAVVDTGSTGSFIAYDYTKRCRLKMDSVTGNVSMVSSSVNISNFTSCSEPSTSVDMPSLFCNLTLKFKSIATKSKRLENDDKRFVQSEIDVTEGSY